MKYNNCVFDIKYANFVEELGMSYETITKAMEELKDKGYLKSTGKRTNLVYHVSPGVCWKGSVWSMYKKLKMFIEE